MPAVFVHGVPDTHRVWKTLIRRLRRDDVVTVSLPGFGCEVPAGFDCSKEAYCDWLLSEVDNVGGPVDLVAHDWGAILALRVASLEPTLIRTWAVGGAPLDPEYEWHKVAKLWQTPEVGEQVMEKLTPETLVPGLAAAGVPAEDAGEAARHVDAMMKRSILALYRSGVRVGAEWEHGLTRVGGRGLVLWGADDPYAAPVFGSRLASRTGARFVTYAGCGHWWQLERPGEVAKELEALWA
jgi:pimeloyl-ACP methyl ester carboxylesterase